jgi:ADP-ribose pyrophosphatase YjhB (NUDIX family)
MKTHIQNIEHDRNKAAHVLLFAEDTSSILAVYPTKALARPHKRDPSKVTKGSKKPWKLPGDKRAVGEALHEAAARGLREKTGLALAKLGATLLASDTVFIGKDAVLLYSVPTELPLTAGEGVHLAQWMPCQGARLTGIASFPLIAALKLVAGVRWRIDGDLLRVIDEDLTWHLPPVLDPNDRKAKKRTVYAQMQEVAARRARDAASA